MKRSNERLIQLARSVNDNVVGTHIGQLCRDMADQLEMMRAAAKGSLMIVEIAIALRRGMAPPPDFNGLAKVGPRNRSVVFLRFSARRSHRSLRIQAQKKARSP